MNESKHRQLMAILTKKGFDADSRHELVYSFTEGRTKSTRELYDLELTDLVNQLNKIEHVSSQLTEKMALKEKRSIVLTIAWNKANGFSQISDN